MKQEYRDRSTLAIMAKIKRLDMLGTDLHQQNNSNINFEENAKYTLCNMNLYHTI